MVTARPAENAAFTGIPVEALNFFTRLRRNNRRDWFAKRKTEYEDTLVTPMKALLREVEGACGNAGLALLANQRSPVGRIYRDIRFSPDKSPFHTFMGAVLTRDGGGKGPGVLYIHVSDKEALVAAGFWQPEREMLQKWRSRIAGHPDEFEAVVEQLKKGRLKLSDGHSLRSMPRGYAHLAETPQADWLKLTSYVVSRPLGTKELSSRSLPRSIAKFAKAAEPLLRFGWSVIDREQKRTRESSIFGLPY